MSGGWNTSESFFAPLSLDPNTNQPLLPVESDAVSLSFLVKESF